MWVLFLVGLVIAAVPLYLAHRSPRAPWDSILAKVGHSDTNKIKGLISKANYFYWFHNLLKSTPLYQRADQLATQAHNDRNALHARVSLMRSHDTIP